MKHTSTTYRIRLLLPLLLLLVGCGDENGHTEAPSGLPASGVPATYVDSATCRGCHRPESKAWEGSHHHLAMQEATEETVLADFGDTEFERFGVTTRFWREGEKFLVRTQNAKGEDETYQVKYVFGIDPLQQYLVEFPDGRVQCLLTAWDVPGKRWFFLYDEPIPAGDMLHWTGPLQNWNYMCAECHTTDLRRSFDLDANTYATTFHEINVGCQACHGPGSEHVAWAECAKADPVAYAAHEDKGLAVDLGHVDPAVQVDACARCHARRANVREAYEFGRPLLDHYDLELLVDPLYFADGQIRDEVYVTGSFLQAKKHAQGVRCTDCHDPHSTQPKREGNALCTHCHQPSPPTEFPTLKAALYDDPAHHHHEPGTEGAACVSCHMPATTYMVVDPRRDHSFRIPRPDLTESLGVPNACNGCHDEQQPAWAAERIRAWYPATAPQRETRPHFATAFAAARRNDPKALPALLELVANEDVAGIVRATATRELRRFPHPDAVNAAAEAATSDVGLIRGAVPDLVEAQIPRQAPRAMQAMAVRILAPLLSDPLRLVRTEAARVLSAYPSSRIDPSLAPILGKVLEEYERRQFDLRDRPEAHLNIGVLRENQALATEAITSYQQALALDPDFLPALFNLATLYNRLDRNSDAELALRGILQRAPKSGEAHYSLGLLLAEEEQFTDAAASLSRAASLMPGRPRIHYNHALVLQHLGRHDEAEAVLLNAHDLDGSNTSILEALAIFYAQRGRWPAAERYALKLVSISGEALGPRQLLAQIRRERGR